MLCERSNEVNALVLSIVSVNLRNRRQRAEARDATHKNGVVWCSGAECACVPHVPLPGLEPAHAVTPPRRHASSYALLHAKRKPQRKPIDMIITLQYPRILPNVMK